MSHNPEYKDDITGFVREANGLGFWSTPYGTVYSFTVWNPYKFDPNLPASWWNRLINDGSQIPTYHCIYCKDQLYPETEEGKLASYDLDGKGVCANCKMVYCTSCDKERERDKDTLPTEEEFAKTRDLGVTDTCLVCKHLIVQELNKKTRIEPLSHIIMSYLVDKSESSFFIDKLFK